MTFDAKLLFATAITHHVITHHVITQPYDSQLLAASGCTALSRPVSHFQRQPHTHTNGVRELAKRPRHEVLSLHIIRSAGYQYCRLRNGYAIRGVRLVLPMPNFVVLTALYLTGLSEIAVLNTLNQQGREQRTKPLSV